MASSDSKLRAHEVKTSSYTDSEGGEKRATGHSNTHSNGLQHIGAAQVHMEKPK